MPPLLAKVAFSFFPSSHRSYQPKEEVPFISQLSSHPSVSPLSRCSRSLTVGASAQSQPSTIAHKQLSMARVNLLREYGLSDQQISKLVNRLRGFLFQSFESLRWALERTEELGFQRGSNMFFHAFVFVGSLKKETFEKKVADFIETCGWSKEEVYAAIRKSPSIFGISTETLKLKADFLVNVAGIKPSTIASQPILLTYSLESRLIPRHSVLSVLQEKELVNKLSLRTMCTFSEKIFIERYIVPYEEDAPELRDVYTAPSQKRMMPRQSLGSIDAVTNESRVASFW